MVETEVASDSAVDIDGRVKSVARKVRRAILELVHEHARAREAAALAEAHHRNPARIRALCLNEPAGPSNDTTDPATLP